MLCVDMPSAVELSSQDCVVCCCRCVYVMLAVWWHVFAGTAFVIALPAIAPTHQSASWVFTTFSPDKAYSGIESNGLLFMLSLLGSQWAMGKCMGCTVIIPSRHGCKHHYLMVDLVTRSTQA